MKKTEWYPGNVKPVRKGWYEWQPGLKKAISEDYCYWNGVEWGQSAYGTHPYPKEAQNWGYWRGILKEPK